jgi:hypothetical protein
VEIVAPEPRGGRVSAVRTSALAAVITLLMATYRLAAFSDRNRQKTVREH